MNSHVDTAILTTLIAGLVTAASWFATNFLTKRREEELRRKQAAGRYLERQIEELYGPLLGLVQQARFISEVAKQRRDQADPKAQDAWRFFAEKYFLPINSQIASLLSSKVHLREGAIWPDSYQKFFKHQAQFECLHSLWASTGISSTDIQGATWPVEFGSDVERTLNDLKQRHSAYLDAVGGNLANRKG